MRKGSQREFKKPLIIPITVVMVVVIHFGYIVLSVSGVDQGILTYFKSYSFEILVLCEVGMLSMIFHNKKIVDSYLSRYEEIHSREELEELKSIVRVNMYAALLAILFLAIGTLTAVMTIVNDSYLKGVIVAALCTITAKVMKWYTPSEQKLKKIPTSNQELENELKDILECWMHRTLPNF